MKLRSFISEAAWIDAAAAELEASARALRACVHHARGSHAMGQLQLCLSGGKTPLPVYAALAGSPELAAALEGISVELWLGDERAVAAESPERNGFLISEAFSGAIWKPAPFFHPWPEGRPERAALEYAALLESRLGPKPVFDLVFLGLGADGHTAGLFPGNPILAEELRLAAPSFAPAEPRERVSLCYPVFERARRIRFLVNGPKKEAVVAALAAGDPALPASRLGRSGEAEILYLVSDSSR